MLACNVLLRLDACPNAIVSYRCPVNVRWDLVFLSCHPGQCDCPRLTVLTQYNVHLSWLMGYQLKQGLDVAFILAEAHQ